LSTGHVWGLLHSLLGLERRDHRTRDPDGKRALDPK
jgi:hypothetical protein